MYVDQPPGFEVKGQELKVYKLKKDLYGLKQSQGHGIVELTCIFSTMGWKEETMSPLCTQKQINKVTC